jgi:hypothetical protein
MLHWSAPQKSSMGSSRRKTSKKGLLPASADMVPYNEEKTLLSLFFLLLFKNNNPIPIMNLIK